MSIEVALLISIISVAFSVYFGLKNSKKSDKEEIAERKLRVDRELAIKELKEKIAAEQKRLEKLEAELNDTNKR